MIVMRAEMFDDLEDRDARIAALQTALELEHATIPVYLYAYYSLDPVKNRAIANLIRSVVMEEMGHFALVCNLINAVGGAPRIDHPQFVPSFPCPLPGSVQEGLQARLAPLSRDLVQEVFMEIEEPETPLMFRRLDADATQPRTIGRFYAAISETLRAAGEDAFVGDPSRQIGPTQAELPNVLPVTDLTSALEAIEIIVEQGEGTAQSPEIDPDDPALDFAHYYKFAMIFHGRRLILDPEAPPGAPPEERYVYGGAPVPLDPAGVKPLPTNPKAADFSEHPELRATVDAFNRAYTAMLRTLHLAANGNPALMSQATAAMKNELRALALQLVTTELPDGSIGAPTFEYLNS